MDQFLTALRTEIQLYASYGPEEKIETIFFGGGTPSLLSPLTVSDILRQLSASFNISSDAEITLETNPGTVDRQKLEGFRATGVNRLSFGVQSFHDDELKFLTRIHTSSEATSAVHMAKQAGFTNINVDLIFALPNQTMERWKDNLRQAIELGTQHISAYNLIVEQNTPLARMVSAKQVSSLPTETEAEMYSFTMDALQQAGFEHYEVSNYCKPGFHSRHNMNYWNHSNYLGFGPSAHSYWATKRWWNVSNIRSYCEKLSAGTLPVVGDEHLSRNQILDERVMLGLRSNGVDFNRLRNMLGIDVLAAHRSTIQSIIDDRLAILDNTVLRLTDKGFLLCDEITRRLLTNISCS